MKSLRARVAVAAIAATAVAFLLSGAVVVGTFAIEFHRAGDGRGPPPWLAQDAPAGGDDSRGFDAGGPPPFVRTLAVRSALVGAGVLVLVGAAGLALGGLALRPLAGLRAAAERVVSTRDLASRLPQGDGPEEVDALATSLNAMLERLQRSSARTEATLDASRRFAADAGHELRTPLTSVQANLDVLARSANLSTDERRILADVAREQARLVALLDGLQRLARADAAEAVPRECLDLADVVDAAVANATARHPQATIEFTGPEAVLIDGWQDGLRLLIDNLLDNAVHHGRARPRIRVALAVDGRSARLTVDDDGPGVPPGDRERVFERFARGDGTRAPGSGLGLAIVQQQAAVHGGSATIDDAPGGGARVTVRLALPGEGEPPDRA